MTGTPSSPEPGDPAAPIVLFDLDGTITDSAPGVIASFKDALERCDIPPLDLPDAEIRSRIVGPPMATTMGSLGLTEEQAAAALAAYHRHYTATGWRDSTAFAGMAQLIAGLAGRSDAAGRPLRLAITTSKQQPMARTILEELELARHFEVIAGAEGPREAKADVIAHALDRLGRPAGAELHADGDRIGTDVGPMLLVGDRHHDVAGAAEHGIPVAFVRWGYGSPAEVEGAAWVVGTPEELERTIVKYTLRPPAPTEDAPTRDADHRLHITFVCTGNICRSPMAQNIVAEHLRRAGLDGAVRVSSAGIGDWHVGDPADPRAQDELRSHGYPVGHAAAQVNQQHLSADLIVALDSGHRRALLAAGADPQKMRMLRSFDPGAGGNTSAREDTGQQNTGEQGTGEQDTGALDVADPYYGGRDGFATVRGQIEAAVDGILDWVRDQPGPRAVDGGPQD